MNKITRVLLHSFLTNVVLSVVKIVAGLLGASGALIADGLHSLSDTMTDVFAIAGNKLSSKPADKKHPYGHGRIEYITCIVIGLIVMAMGITIIYEAIFKPRVIPDLYTALVGLIVIIAKLVLARYILKKGQLYNSNILMASGRESFSDVISSVVVLISILVAQLAKFNEIFVYADIVAMLIVGILILRIAYTILRDNFSGLLGEQVTDEAYINDIKKIILAEKEVQNIDSLIILKYGPFYQINCEVSMAENIRLKKAHAVLDVIESKLKKFDQKICHIIIHINPCT